MQQSVIQHVCTVPIIGLLGDKFHRYQVTIAEKTLPNSTNNVNFVNFSSIKHYAAS
jgi:hypothetical protein